MIIVFLGFNFYLIVSFFCIVQRLLFLFFIDLLVYIIFPHISSQNTQERRIRQCTTNIRTSQRPALSIRIAWKIRQACEARRTGSVTGQMIPLCRGTALAAEVFCQRQGLFTFVYPNCPTWKMENISLTCVSFVVIIKNKDTKICKCF